MGKETAQDNLESLSPTSNTTYKSTFFLVFDQIQSNYKVINNLISVGLGRQVNYRKRYFWSFLYHAQIVVEKYSESI